MMFGCNVVLNYGVKASLWRYYAFWGKPVVRFQGSDKGNWPDAFCFNIAADDPWLLLRIPQKESNNNAGIVNNTGGNLPVAGQNPNLKEWCN